MKHVTLMTIAMLLLAGTAALAQCPPPACPPPAPVCAPACPPPAPVCEPVPACPPPPCPVACPPAPCPVPACPEPVCCPTKLGEVPAQCPCPCYNPSMLGAGPTLGLCDLTCTDFDKMFAAKLYNQNTAIIAVTTMGIERATDSSLRDISGEIRTRLTSENLKLADWYGRMGFGTIPVDYMRVQTISDSLNQGTGACFDTLYAQTLSGLLQQAKDAQDLGVQKSNLDVMKQQAEFMSGVDADYIFRLNRWVSEKGVTQGQ